MSELIAGIFERAVPIRFEDHRHLRFSDSHDYRFAAGLVEVPLAYTEWVSAAKHYPVVFSATGSGRPDSVNALLRLSPEAQNPFLNAANGQWLPDHYIPQYLRFYPFMMDLTSPTAQVLMAVLEAPHFSDSVGEPLFNDAGEMSPALQKRFADLKTYLDNINRTRSLIGVLDGEGLLSLSQVFRDEDSAHEKLVQVVSVDPEKLSKKPPEALARLNQRGVLPLAYAQIHSLENLNRLDRANRAPAKRPGHPSVDHDAAPANGGETKNRYLGLASMVGMAAAFLLGSWLGPFWQSDAPAEDVASSPPSMQSPGKEDIRSIEPPTPALADIEPKPAESGAATAEEVVAADLAQMASDNESGESRAAEAVAQPLRQPAESGSTQTRTEPGLADEAAAPSQTPTTIDQPATAPTGEIAPPLPAWPADQAQDSSPVEPNISEAQTELEIAGGDIAPSPAAATGEQTDVALVEANAAPLPARPADQAEDSAPAESVISAAKSADGIVKQQAAPSLAAAAGNGTSTAPAQQIATPQMPQPAEQAQDSPAVEPDTGTSETQTESAAVAEDAPPPLAPAVREEIQILLENIQVNIRRDRLSRPADDNAIAKINRIFELDPDNLDAKAAMDNVIDRYITLARETRGWVGKTYLQTAHRLNPGRSDIDDAWDEIYAPERPAWHAGN